MAAEAKDEELSLDAKNREIQMVTKPEGKPKLSDFKMVDVDMPECGEGEFVCESMHVSVDPYLRGVMRMAEPGTVITCGTVAKVTESKVEAYAVGDVICGLLPWRVFNKVTAEQAKSTGVRKIDTKTHPQPLSSALGILGMPGMTSYFGTLRVCEIKEGDVILVSGAAGAVGSAVGQIAKIKGCTVIGTASTKEKLEYLKEIGFDHVFSYREFDTQEKVVAKLKEIAPKGVDAYFDNTGGHITDAFFDVCTKFSRVAVCGQISMYNDTEVPMGPKFLHKIIYKSVKVQGFVVRDFYSPKNLAEFFSVMGPWVKEKKVTFRETVHNGFESIPKAFIELFEGSNTGKMVINV